MTAEIFQGILMNGDVALIKNGSSSWPLSGWSCADFRTHPYMKGFQVERVYGGRDGSFVPLCDTCEQWEEDVRDAHNDDASGPTLAPLYWDVKADKRSIDVIDELTPPWTFLNRENYYWKRNAVELWFSPRKAGAKYHMDGHVQMTVVSQLVGTRRWRLSLLPDEAQSVLPNHLDSNVFEWQPELTVTLETGDILMFPPGSVHDTLNVGESCAASVTHQLGAPLPVKFYRRNLKRVLSTGDTREIWPAITDLVSYGFLRPKLSASLPYFEPHENATYIFPSETAYNESDPEPFFRYVYRKFYSELSLPGHFGYRRQSEYVAFHDTDADGKVSESEFLASARQWLSIEHEIMNVISAKFRPARYFYKDLEGVVPDDYWTDLYVFQANLSDRAPDDPLNREEL